MFDHVFCCFGIPEDMVRQSPQFTFQVWNDFVEKLGTTVTSGYHPQLNGQVERANQEEGQFLQTFCANKQKDWARFLLWA